MLDGFFSIHKVFGVIHSAIKINKMSFIYRNIWGIISGYPGVALKYDSLKNGWNYVVVPFLSSSKRKISYEFWKGYYSITIDIWIYGSLILHPLSKIEVVSSVLEPMISPTLG